MTVPRQFWFHRSMFDRAWNPRGTGRQTEARVRSRYAILLGGVLWITLSVANPDLGRVVELALQRYGPDAGETVAHWRDLIEQNLDLPEVQKLELVNNFFNHSVLFEDDSVTWGVRDYWATPLETLGRGQGDCEDFSIGKYVSLGLMGVAIDRLRITYVRAESGLAGSGISQAHMVLAYYATPEAEPLILDNLIGELRPASRRPDLTPVFGFNSQGLWVAGFSAPALADPTSRLSRWRNLLRRMNEDGLN
jgi:predicted transglutaminase-like cysteine proteinase